MLVGEKLSRIAILPWPSSRVDGLVPMQVVQRLMGARDVCLPGAGSA